MSLVCNFVKGVLLCVMFLGAFVHSMQDSSPQELNYNSLMQALEPFNSSAPLLLKGINKQFYKAYWMRVDPNWLNWLSNSDDTRKERVYEKAFKITHTLNKTALFDAFSAHWHDYRGTLFLCEKINEKEKKILKQGRSSSKSLYAIRPNDYITQRYVANSAHLEVDSWPVLCETPTFGELPHAISLIDHCITACISLKPLLYISYNASQHKFIQYCVGINASRNSTKLEKLEAEVFHYPRLLKKFMNFNPTNSWNSSDTLGNKVYCRFYQIESAAIVPHIFAVRKNFVLHDEPAEQSDVLAHLFASHIGDNRSQNITKSIISLYKLYQKKLRTHVHSQDTYVTMVKGHFFKTPITKQTEHIDDFHQFCDELGRLYELSPCYNALLVPDIFRSLQDPATRLLAQVCMQFHKMYQSDLDTCKKKLYQQAFKIAHTPDKKDISNKADLLQHFKVYWNPSYKTLFLSEKLNKKDEKILRKIRKQENGEDCSERLCSQPPKKVYAIKNLSNWISQDYINCDTNLKISEWPKFCKIPTFGMLPEESNSCITVCIEPGRYISYDPLEHDFMRYTAHIFPDFQSCPEEVIGKIFYYPRLFEKLVNSSPTKSKFNDFCGAKEIYNRYELDTFPGMDPEYKKIIQKNFLLRGEPIKKNDILVRLFTSHSGDERSPATTHCIASLYEKYQKKLGCTRSKDKYVKIVTKQFFKSPAEQKKHIDDFGQFCSKLDWLYKLGTYHALFVKDIFNQLDNSIQRSLAPVNKQFHRIYWNKINHPAACKKMVYKRAFEIARTPDKQPISNKTDLLHHFKAYWNKPYETLFLLEKLKLNNEDQETLQRIRKRDQCGQENCIAPPSKHVYAIRYPDKMVGRKYEISPSHLDEDQWPQICETPTFGDSTLNTLLSKNPNLCITIATEPGQYISYNPLKHNFMQHVVHIFPDSDREEITHRLFYYPRLFRQFVSSLPKWEEQKAISRTDHYYELDTFPGMDPEYKKIIRENFLLQNKPTKKHDIIVRLFTLHSGDNRQPTITDYITLLYKEHEEQHSIYTQNEYITMVKDRFFKPPAEQREHIDDFNQFCSELVPLYTHPVMPAIEANCHIPQSTSENNGEITQKDSASEEKSPEKQPQAMPAVEANHHTSQSILENKEKIVQENTAQNDTPKEIDIATSSPQPPLEIKADCYSPHATFENNEEITQKSSALKDKPKETVEANYHRPQAISENNEEKTQISLDHEKYPEKSSKRNTLQKLTWLCGTLKSSVSYMLNTAHSSCLCFANSLLTLFSKLFSWH
jgi:hypothetical protein